MSAEKYSLVLDEGAQVEMARLQRAYNLPNKAAVYDLSVRILTWIAQQQVQGHEFGRYNTSTEYFEPLIIPQPFDKDKWVN